MMTNEPQPELRWAPIPPKPRNRGRVWLIVGLVLATLLIAALVLLFLIPRDGEPEPTPSPTATTTSTATPTPTATASPTPTPTATPTTTPSPTPTTTPPPVADPSVEAFGSQVGGWLDDALTGLDIVSESSGPDALSVVDTLQQDAQRLSDSVAPASIDAQWRDGVALYSQRLQELRAAIDAGADTSGAVSAGVSAVGELNSLVGR